MANLEVLDIPTNVLPLLFLLSDVYFLEPTYMQDIAYEIALTNGCWLTPRLV